MILIENNFDVHTLEEATKEGNDLYLNGVFMEANKKNQNGRIYRRDEISQAADRMNEAAKQGRHILGEMDHRDDLNVALSNVSHKIVDMKMEGDQAIGKAQILKTPNGQIARSLVESGVNIGVSSRGSGSVNESTGEVSNFNAVTIDIVANPSCQSAVPQSIWERLDMYRNGEEINKLAEAVVHDPKAQKYFTFEVRKFIQDCFQQYKK